MAQKVQRSFIAGEVSPSVHARADLQRYAEGLKTLRNCVVLRTGGVQNAPGTQYLASTKSDGVARIVSVVFDDDQGFILEFGNLYVRFVLAGAYITATVTGAWANTTAYTAGLVVSYLGTNYVCLVAHTSVQATDRPSDGSSWETKWYALTGTTYELPTPYTSAQLPYVKFASQLNVVTIAHRSHALATLTRTSNNVWDLANGDFSDVALVPQNVAITGTAGTDFGYTVTAAFGGTYSSPDTESTAGAYVRTNISGTFPAIAANLATTPRTLSWNAVSGADFYRIYVSAGANEQAYLLMVVGGAATSIIDDGSSLSTSFPSNPPTSSGAFDAAGEYPSVVAAFQQRLLLGGSDNEPDVTRASRSADPYNFSVSDPIVDSDAMSWRQVGRELQRIVDYAEVGNRLIQFMSRGEGIIQGDVSGILRPGEVNPRQISGNGSAKYPSPLVINDTALYIQARGGIVRDLVPAQSGFAGSDLTLLSAHLVDGYTITGWCCQQTPNSTVWMVRSDGTLLALTYVRELGIVGWATRDTDGVFLSVACVPESGRDAVYAVVERTINGSTKRYVERFYDRLATSGNAPVIMDCAKTVTI